MRKARSKALMAFLLLLAVSTAVFVARARPAARAATQTGPEHVLSFAYYSIKGDWDSTLTLNNSSVSELAAIVTVYSLDGEALRLPSLYLKPNSNIAVLLSELVSRTPRIGQFQEGSIDVRFNSDDSMAIAPQLTVSDSQHGLSFDMEPPMMLMSSTLEGLWWSSDKKTSGQVMLSNTTDQNLDALVNVQWRGTAIPAPPVSLSAHQTTVLEIEKLLKNLHIEAVGIERGGLSITHNGSPGALIAHGLIQNKEARFASNLPFVDPTTQKYSVLDGAGLMLGRPAPGSAFPETSFFTPQLALKNALKTLQRATITVRYFVGTELRTTTLPNVDLAPYEVRMADFSALMSSLRDEPVTGAGLKIKSSGSPGTLIAALSSVDGSRSIEVDVPLVSRSERSGEGGNHPFRLGETLRSVAYMTNITQKPTKVAVIIFHEAGMFTPELISVGPGGTVAIDLLQLRDSQAKDIQGRTLPVSLTQGQFFWHPHEGEALIGRVVTFNKADGTASNFSCPNCCQLEPSGLNILPTPINGVVGDFYQLTVNMYETYCGQFTVGPYNYTTSVAYSCNNTSVATVNSTGGVSCMGLGNATITVSFDYYHSDFTSGEDCGLFLATATETAPVTVVPTVQITFNDSGIPLCADDPPPPGAAGYRCSAPMTAQGNPSGGTYSWSTTSTKVTLSGTNLETVTVIGQSESVTQNDVVITVTYTLNGQQGTAQRSVTVQKPTFMGYVSTDFSRAFTGCDPGHAGWEKTIVWQVQDKFHGAMSFSMAIWDSITNNTPNSCSVPSGGFIDRPEDGLATGPTGLWGHHYGLCSIACTSGTCSVSGTQTYTVNGFNNIGLSFTMTCSSITVDGH